MASNKRRIAMASAILRLGLSKRPGLTQLETKERWESKMTSVLAVRVFRVWQDKLLTTGNLITDAGSIHILCSLVSYTSQIVII